MGNDLNNNEEQNQEDDQEIYISRGMTVLGLVVILLLVFVVGCLFRGCSVSKDTKSTQVSKIENSAQKSSVEIATNRDVESVKNGENTSELNVSVTAPPVNNSVDDLENFESDGGKKAEEDTKSGDTDASKMENTENGMFVSECEDPDLGDVESVSAVVVEKNVFESDSSYVYRVTLKSDGIGEYYYLCPRKTFDNLVVDDYITVEYQMSSGSKISICSITK